MSIKYYDEKTGKYIPYTSKWANGIRIIDTEGNFVNADGETSETVEDALKLLANKQSEIEERVEYIYENGTIGGGGGGGSVLPTLKLISPFATTDTGDYAKISISSGAEVNVEYNFQSPNIGKGTVTYTISGDKTLKETVQIDQGSNKHNFGTFPTGSYRINIHVVDAGGLYSNTLTVAVESGSLELTSTFNDGYDFTLSDNIEIYYTVKTISDVPITITYNVDGIESTRTLDTGGNYVWSVGQMSFIGVHKLSISAVSGQFVSNVLSFNIIVADSDTMFIASTFDEEQIQEGRDIVIPYRVSMSGENRAIIKKWINGEEQSSDTVMLGTGNYLFWKIGNQLAAGSYLFELQATTTDGAVVSNKLSYEVEIITQSFTRIKAVLDDTTQASFIADNKSSSSDSKNIWEDKSGNNVSCVLRDFNHVTNGWDGYSLNFDGRAYAEIDLAPWKNNCANGFTFDVYYKTENIGDINACVLWMKNNETPNQGLYINTQKASLTSGGGKVIETIMKDSSKTQENWQHVTFVVNRKTNLMELFVNGVLTQAVRLNLSESFTFDGKIYLGGKYVNGNIESQGKCSIRAINIYNRTLTDEEIVNNYISCLSYPDAQEKVWRLNYDDQQIPRMDVAGNLTGITDDDDVTPLVTLDYVDYVDRTKSFNLNQCKISLQGTSSQLYPVKNYTIQLRSNGQDWLYSPKDDWIKCSRFTLKANYIDQSSANNISNARFFNDLIRAYHPYPSQQINNQCRGTIDGFPIRLYINDEYQGLYTFNIDRYAPQVLGFDLTGSTMAYEISANTNAGTGAFFEQENDTATWNSIKKEFKYRYHYAGDQKIVCEKDASDGNQTVLKQGSYHTELVNLVKWTSRATAEEFRGDIATHWSLNHLIDYFLYVYLSGLCDNFGKNLVITNFSKNVNLDVIWYVMMYDADSCLGLSNDGFLIKEPSMDLANAGDFNTIESQLWQKLIDKDGGFWSEIMTRYAQLRNEKWFTLDKLLSYIDSQFIGTIGQRFYNEDARLKYTKTENQSFLYLVNGTRLEYTKRWLEERIKYLDSVFDYATAYDKRASIRTNANDYLTLKMKAKSPRFIKIKWSDKLNYQKYFVSSDKYYEFTSPEMITNTDNNLDMLGIEDITEVETFEHLKPSALHLMGMENLTSLKAPNSKYLSEVLLEKNTMLQTVDLKNCTNLGLNSTGESTGNLNLINCENLKYLDVSKTALASLNIIDIDIENPDPTQAVGTGSLEFFDASETAITDVTLWNQTYLEEIKISDCYKLATISIGNCERLVKLSLPNSQINKFVIVDCNALVDIDISNTPKLTTLRLDGCPNLLKLNLKQLNSPTLLDLDLTTVPNLIDLNVANTSFLQHITFPESFNKLTSLDMRNSVLTSIRFGKRVEFPSYMDLSPFKLTSVSFYNCNGLTEIKGLNYIGSGAELFYNCTKLATISGNLTINGSMDRMCYNCQSLNVLPTLNLKNATNASETFYICKALTMNNLKAIMNACGDKLVTSWRMFGNCTNITGALPSNLFATTPKFSSLNEFFIGCAGITGVIPSNFFAYLGSSLTNCRYMFSGTNIACDIDLQWFSNNTNLSTIERMFNGIKTLTGTIPAALFLNNTNLQNTSYCFSGCTGIQSRIPSGLFSHNTKIQNVEGMFVGCKGLYGTIPSDLFKNANSTNYELTNCKSFVENCTEIYGQLPDELFKYTPKLMYCDSMFANTGIYGNIPTDLFAYTPQLSTASRFFLNCTGLATSIPVELFHNLVGLSNVSNFFNGCNELTGIIPTGLFTGCTSLAFVDGLFKDCRKIYGDIPTDLFDYSPNMQSIASLFENCYNLTSNIPSNIFEKCLKVKDMSRVFANCYNLTDSIPDGLFDNCINAITMAGMFLNCKQLGNRFVSESNPYAMPETLFDNCPNLVTINDMFNMWGAIGTSPQLKGELPPRLFEVCSKLENANYCFAACPIDGELSEYMIARSRSLKDISYMFASTGITLLSDNFLKNNTALTNVKGLFRDCTQIQGNSTQFWNGNYPKITEYGECYRNCNKLNDFANIPSTWK